MIYLSISLSLCLSVCLSIYPSIYLSMYPYISVSFSLSLSMSLLSDLTFFAICKSQDQKISHFLHELSPKRVLVLSDGFAACCPQNKKTCQSFCSTSLPGLPHWSSPSHWQPRSQPFGVPTDARFHTSASHGHWSPNGLGKQQAAPQNRSMAIASHEATTGHSCGRKRRQRAAGLSCTFPGISAGGLSWWLMHDTDGSWHKSPLSLLTHMI